MDHVEVRNQDGDRQYEKQHVAHDKVRAPEGQLDDLDDEFSGRLRDNMAAKTTTGPPPAPPRPVALIVLELSSEQNRDKDLVNCSLDGDNRNKPEKGMPNVPTFEEPLWKSQIERLSL